MVDDRTELPTDEVEIRVRGERYSGWVETDVHRALDAASGAFSFTAVASRDDRWPIRPRDAISIRFGSTTVLTGFVEGLEATTSSSATAIKITGRDATADLIDSSATNEPGELRNLNLFEIADELAEPFGVLVERGAGVDPGPVFPVFKLNPGEGVWAAIERAARLRGVLVHTDGLGALLFAKPGALRASVRLVEGANVLEAKLSWNMADRFRTYIVRGQRPGSDEGWGDIVAAVEGTAIDEEVDRFRPLLTIAPGTVSIENATDLAQWEAAVRRARSLTVSVKVPSWRQKPEEGAAVWAPNMLVDVDLGSLTVRREMLVRSVKFQRAQAGTVTSLQLVPADAFDPKPTIADDASDFDGLVEGGGWD